MSSAMFRASILHGAGYVGRELLRLLDAHPHVHLVEVTSHSHAGRPFSDAHPALRGIAHGTFSAELSDFDVDVVFVAAGHGRGAEAVKRLLEQGYGGRIIDMSADFRLRSQSRYEETYGAEHPAPDLIGAFRYGLPEIVGPHPAGTRFIANPGCFATAIALALHPLVRALPTLRASVTALTGASGSGARASATTHFPDRDGNVRAYRVLSHRHTPEVLQTLGLEGGIAFTPVSAPWTHGIWGTASVELPPSIAAGAVVAWFEGPYAGESFIRLYPDELPELAPVVRSPFCDLGWTVSGRELVVGFALDNLLKGAASQAVQNMNLLLGIDHRAGLLPLAQADLHPHTSQHA